MSEEQSIKQSIITTIKNPKYLIGIGSIVLLGSGYLLYRHFNKTTEATVEPTEPAQTLIEGESKTSLDGESNTSPIPLTTSTPAIIEITEEMDEKEREAELRRQKEEAKIAKMAKFGKAKEKKIRLRSSDFVNPTPVGEKKDLSHEAEDVYDPAVIEAAWDAWWETQGFYRPEYYDDDTERESYVIVIPPPNVTGSLHIGHALSFSVEDALVRYNRMMGKKCLWVPGVDHAGIATQTVVEKKLMKEEGLSKYDLGREAFLEKVWEWKAQYGDRIHMQLRRLGASVDWSRVVFTMDEELNKAVVEAFIQWFERGLIYRDNRLVNWSCALQTAISDIECDDIELKGPTRLTVKNHPKNTYQFGCIWEFSYKVVGTDEELIVATTRPETMLGDTGVAVHPDDERYKHLHGKMLQHPFIDRQIPIITDSILVDMEKGTGAVKVTPAHDQHDFECGQRNNLEFINILNRDGTLNENAGEYVGLPRYQVREMILERLEAEGFYKGVKDNAMVLSQCSRSGDIIEPFLIPQWWVNIDNMAAQAIDKLESGELKILPESKHHVWYETMGKPRPWCISRQLWWGHRCPAYQISIDGELLSNADQNSWVIGRNIEEARENASKKLGHNNFELFQDEDVLDTWFSSGLFPFSVMGWPDETSDMANFYPNSILETGHDILFFWVARMVMMGLELTGKLPFKEVFLHSMVRDSSGEKMSKSKGNVIDPLDVTEGIEIELLHENTRKGNLDAKEIKKAISLQKKNFGDGISECGTDAMRFGLLGYTASGKDINLDINIIYKCRNFCNKIWQSSKLISMFQGNNFIAPATYDLSGNESEIDLWILHKLNETIKVVAEGISEYDFGKSSYALESFWWNDVCDVYLELIKPTMWDKEDTLTDEQLTIANTLYILQETYLRLLHPFMPFITEELWQRLSRREGDAPSVMVSAYPQPKPEWENLSVLAEMEIINTYMGIMRSTLSTYNINKKLKPQLTISTTSEDVFSLCERYKKHLQTLGYVGEIVIGMSLDSIPKCAIAVVDEVTVFYVHIAEFVDADKEIQKLNKKKALLVRSITGSEKKQSGKNWSKIPEEIRLKELDNYGNYQKELESIDEALDFLNTLKE